MGWVDLRLAGRERGSRRAGRGSLRALAALILAAVLAVGPAPVGMAPAGAGRAEARADIRHSVVKIFTTAHQPELTRPWTKAPPAEFTGSGVVIEGRRILTNAHMVSYASRVLVQSPRSGDRFPASVVARAEGIDLALLELEDGAFFDAHPPAPLTEALPQVGDTVQAYGYPVGGDELSITRGIVSRIEYTSYYYEAYGLRIQVDAALNPGNSGGPAVVDGGVIGLVFSVIRGANNIGYLIPTEEIQAFLDDIEDGEYRGQPYLLDLFEPLENPDLREQLGLDAGTTGVMVLTPWSDAPDYPLKARDVVTAIGEQPINNRGMIRHGEDLRLYFEYLCSKLEEGGTVPLSIIRDGGPMRVRAPVSASRPRLLPYLKNDYPSYLIYGPLVFTPAYADHLGRLDLGHLATRSSPIAARAHARPAFEGEQLVVVSSPLFPHRMAIGYELPEFPTLKSVNGIEIKNLPHLAETLRRLDDRYVDFEWHDRGVNAIVFERREALRAMEEILEGNGIRRPYSPDLAAAWEGR
jgi:S1-C subfamily serine protease